VLEAQFFPENPFQKKLHLMPKLKFKV